MNLLLKDRIPFPKILMVLAISFVIAAGLVLLAGQLPCPVGPCPYEKFSVGYLGDLGILVLLLSATCFVVTFAMWVGLAVVASFSRSDAGPQRLFDVKANKNKPD